MQTSKVFKIHIPSIKSDHMIGELKNIIVAGVIGNLRTKLCDDIEAADYVFLDFRHLISQNACISHPEKTVIVDYRDNPLAIFPHQAFLYFKRSIVDPVSGNFLKYEREVNSISYCVKNQYYRQSTFNENVRDIDIAVFFDLAETPDTARDYYRCTLAHLIKNNFSNLNIHVGIAGNAGVVGRNEFQQSYFDLMVRSKIVVTCNPDRCEGDYRLFEALSSGSLVLTDKMITPVVNPFIDYEHLVYYDKTRMDNLVDSIKWLLAEDIERTRIAANGYEHAMNFHSAPNKINEILAVATRQS